MCVYAAPSCIDGESQIPASDLELCESELVFSQLTQLTLVPRLTVTCSGMNVKFLIRMTTVPAAAVGIAHSPVIGSGPVACFSEKQLAKGRLAAATVANAVRVAAFRERNRQLTRVNPPLRGFAPDTYRRLPIGGARARASARTVGRRQPSRPRVQGERTVPGGEQRVSAGGGD